jgi:predicted helicase
LHLRREAQRLATLAHDFAAATVHGDDYLPPALACASFALRLLERRNPSTCAAALRLASATPPCDQLFDVLHSLAKQDLLIAARAMAEEFSGDGDAEQITQFVEHFLAAFDEPARRRHGVYYTPAIIAEYLVARADAALADHFPAIGGVAGAAEIFDPAVGTGVFPLAAIDQIHATLAARWRADGEPDDALAERWDDYVRTSLLQRLRGYELMPAAQVVAQLLIGERLAAYGFRPQAGDRLRIDVADALSFTRNPVRGPSVPMTQALSPRERRREGPVVVLGNPPYRGVSASEHAWVDDLLRGNSPAGKKVASYFHVDGEPLGEKKHWLHDDYVKFFRLAHWRIEQAGAGVVAFVTNHGYLDNPTFRGMRCGLLETFNEFEVVDLHGNVKHGAAARDESVFTTQQGMALSLLIAGPDKKRPHVVRRADLRGSRREKLDLLSQPDVAAIAFDAIRPQAPNYFFHAESTAHNGEYERFWPIDEILPVNTTAIVTARDSLVIAFTREELVQRLARFRDLSIPDEQIRRDLFPRSRTGKYPPGDTRGWKLRNAREQLAADDRWQENIRTCLYRPFDRRYIYWSPSMIDWPRPDVMRHMEADGNLAIVCRRQQVRGAPCNFFWIADDLVIDGYIRSDNRGSESIFPLWLAPTPSFNRDPTGSAELPNTSSAPYALPVGSRLNEGIIADIDLRRLLPYAYAVFHSSKYRERYAERLTSQFPHIPPPPSRAIFEELAALGDTLIDLHLLRVPLPAATVQLNGDANCIVAPGYPQFLRDAVALAPGAKFESISPAAWQFQVGAHQVLRKWLKDRRGRKLSPNDAAHYARMVASVERTLTILPQIDAAIAPFNTQARSASEGSDS